MFVPNRTSFRSARLRFLAACLTCVIASCLQAEATTVTVMKKAPLESLSATGEISGVSEAVVGTHYTLVQMAGAQAVVRDAAGNYQIAVAATDYVPPAAAPAAAAPTPTALQTNAAPQATNLAVTVTAPTTLSPASSASANRSMDSTTGSTPIPDDKLAEINTGLGKPIFSTGSFWQESALTVAQRLGLGLEGKTKWETSYRRYFSGDPADPKSSLLGTGAYCVALYADADDHPTSLLIAFNNDGDYKNVVNVTSDLYRIDHPVAGAYRSFPGMSKEDLTKKYEDIVASFETDRKNEERLLIKNLSALFGDARNTIFGSDVATREETQRWDWNDVSLLLTGQVNKYNLLRIVPTALADSNGRGERIPRDEIGKKLSDAVEHRPNGDVVITQIPMADQGPKGYCVPATWERVLRYEGVPGDMYTLSRIGNAGFGGGERGGAIAVELNDTLHNYGRHTEFLDMTIVDAISLRHYIDDGVPVFWSLNPTGYAPALQRYSLLDRNKDWDQWKTLLEQSKSQESAKKTPLDSDGGHQVLIIGYNPDTREIAWSDPWGRDTSERWMTMAEAQRCSLSQYYIITW